MAVNDTLDVANLDPNGHGLKDLCRGPIDIALHNINCGPHGFRRFSH